ncbi:MAG: CHAT domain-containing tetratricopeptide repeat protein [Bacteroidota bacterium]
MRVDYHPPTLHVKFTPSILSLGLLALFCLAACLPRPQASPLAIKTKASSSSSQALEQGHELFLAGMQSYRQRDVIGMDRNFSAAMDSFWLAGAKDSAYLAASKQIAACIFQYSSDRAIVTHKRFAPNFIEADTSMAIAKLLNNAAAAYSNLFQDPTAQQLLDQVRQIHHNRIAAQIDSGIGSKLLSDNYNNQGLIFYRVGTELKDVGFPERALQKLEIAISKFDTANIIFQDSDLIQSASQKAAQRSNRGLVLMAMDRVAKSIENFDQAYELEQSMAEPDSELMTNYFYNKGLAYLSQDDVAQAIPILEAAKAFYVKKHGPAAFLIFENYALLAKAYLKADQAQIALKNCQEALASFSLGNEIFDDPWQNPSLDNLLIRVELLELFTYKLEALNQIYDFNDLATVQKILPTYELAFSLLDQLKTNGYSETSSYFISYYSSEILKTFLGLAERHPSIVPLAFQQLDNNRASYLLQGLTLSRLQAVNALPDSLQEQEKKLENSINQLSLNRILFSKEGPQYAPMVASFTEQLQAEKGKKAALEAQILKLNPAYHGLRYAQNDALAQAKDLLTEEQVLLEYFVGENSIYTFKVDQSEVQLFTCKVDSVADWISHLTGNAMRDSSSNELTLSFIPYANKLYQRLLAPILTDLDSSYNRLAIIPDGIIASLPFSMLAKDADSTNFRKIPFLMKDYAIGYGYSTSSFAMQQQQYTNQALPKGTLLAVAPTFPTLSASEIASRQRDSAEYFTKLDHTEEEINNIQVNAKKTLKGTKANPESFLALWNQYQFIHLATHALSNEAFPDEAGIAFAHKEKGSTMLRIKDLPDKPWYAKMMVLSACQTATGQQVTGEGIISLARVFALKGVQSVVATQWNIGDEQTPKLIEKFYQNLQAGMPRDIALQKAQLSVIEGGDDITYADGHPKYWAAFSLYGDSSPVDFPEGKFPTIPFILGLAVMGLIWGIWYRVKQ